MAFFGNQIWQSNERHGVDSPRQAGIQVRFRGTVADGQDVVDSPDGPRQPVLWVPPTAAVSAIKLTRSGAEQRARTTAAGRRRATPNGTSWRARGPHAISAAGSARHAVNRQR